MPGARCPRRGRSYPNIENNPMQSSLAVAGRHARSREDVLTCRRKRAPLRQIGTTGKLRMARMHAAPVGLIQTECFRERAGIDSVKPVISSHPRSTLAPDPRFAGRMVWGRYSGTADFSAASSASFEGEGIWRRRMRLPHPNPPAKCGRGSASSLPVSRAPTTTRRTGSVRCFAGPPTSRFFHFSDFEGVSASRPAGTRFWSSENVAIVSKSVLRISRVFRNERV